MKATPAVPVPGSPEVESGIILGEDGAFFEDGYRWVPVVKIDADNSNHLSQSQGSNKLSDSEINRLRGSYSTSMFWLQCGPCNAYVQQDIEWAATREAAKSKIEYCSLSPSGPFAKSGLSEEEKVKSDIHHGVDCFGIQTVYGQSKRLSGSAMMREAYEESIVLGGKSVPQPGCYCNGAGHAGMLYVSAPPKLGVAGPESSDGRVWIPVVNIPATSTEQVHTGGSADKLSDMAINQLRNNLASSLLWLKCGPCNVYVSQPAAFVANGDRAAGSELSHCGPSSAGPYAWQPKGGDPTGINRGISCGDEASLVVYQRGSEPGCYCNGNAWRPGTLLVAGGAPSAPTPAPTSKPMAPLGEHFAKVVGSRRWVPVAQIFTSNIDHIITAQTDYKLSDEDINTLRGDYAHSLLWLQCGPCDAYVQENMPWVSDGFTSASSNFQHCASKPAGPFVASGDLSTDRHRGLDC
eukprot:g7371.t1